MLMGSKSPGWLDLESEAYPLTFDGQKRHNHNVDGLAVSGQGTSVADKDEKIIQILGKPVWESSNDDAFSIKLDQEAISPEPTVCTLAGGQYLPCGIGLRTDLFMRAYLTSADIRRWDLCASAIIEILKTTSPRDEISLADTVKIDYLYNFLSEHQIHGTFAIHIPNFRMDDVVNYLGEYFDVHESVLKDTGLLLLYLLRFFIPLTAAYGGIHLTAWNFEFPSRVESIIWRTACFVIVGSSFTFLVIPSWTSLMNRLYGRDYVYTRADKKISRSLKSMRALTLMMGLGSAGLLLLCYPASRLYLVVESFLSLRQVPIGVYAAVPWVQNIPHV